MNRKVVTYSLFAGAFALTVMNAIATQRLTGQVVRSTTTGRVSVLDFGAIGDGRTDDRAAIQAAIDAGDEIHFPEVPAFYRVVGSLKIGGHDKIGGKRFIGHRPCHGSGPIPRKPALIHGDGSASLLVAEGTTAQNRSIELIGLSAINLEKPVLDLISGTDALVENCSLKSLKTTDAAVRVRDSYNVTIRESSVFCAGGGFAITAYQQCNKLRIQNCRLGGGDTGGATHLEQSAAVQFEGNIIEPSEYGVIVAAGIRLDQPEAGNVDGAGVCHAIRIAANYFENVQYPIVIASALNRSNHLGLPVLGAAIEANNISTYGFDFPLLTVGRLKAATIRANSFTRMVDGKAPAVFGTFARAVSPSHASDCTFETNHLANGDGPFFGADEVNIGTIPLLKKLEAENRISNPAP